MAPLAWRMIGVLVVGMCVALLAGCNEKTDPGIAKVKIGDRSFFLEVVADDATRYKGLGGRDQLAEDGGMLFVFPAPQLQQFVMRDCTIPIDIIYLDGAGRILKMHEMKVEKPREANERAEVPDEDQRYNDRLPRYSSKFPSLFVVELKGGMLKQLGLNEGDVIKHDWEALKRLAR